MKVLCREFFKDKMSRTIFFARCPALVATKHSLKRFVPGSCFCPAVFRYVSIFSRCLKIVDNDEKYLEFFKSCVEQFDWDEWSAGRNCLQRFKTYLLDENFPKILIEMIKFQHEYETKSWRDDFNVLPYTPTGAICRNCFKPLPCPFCNEVWNSTSLQLSSEKFAVDGAFSVLVYDNFFEKCITFLSQKLEVLVCVSIKDYFVKQLDTEQWILEDLKTYETFKLNETTGAPDTGVKRKADELDCVARSFEATNGLKIDFFLYRLEKNREGNKVKTGHKIEAKIDGVFSISHLIKGKLFDLEDVDLYIDV
mgnify:CR=1 FL=1